MSQRYDKYDKIAPVVDRDGGTVGILVVVLYLHDA